MNTHTKISRFLSLVLRHKPEEIGLSLNDQGWVDVSHLMEKMSAAGKRIDRTVLEEVVANNDKKRFEFSEDGTQIRARQGHSVEVDLALNAVAPPEFLYHGTAQRFLSSIFKEGLLKQSRHHVHLSQDLETASKVGVRHGKLAILKLRAAHMHADGFTFYHTANGVWLVDNVPVQYIDRLPT